MVAPTAASSTVDLRRDLLVSFALNAGVPALIRE
jgi:hypothetical protein